MNVEIFLIDPTYSKGNGAWALNTQELPVDIGFQPVEQALISLPPGQVAGNHTHPRREALIGLGQAAYFLWQDNDGTIHKEAMNPDGQLQIFSIPPHIPHAVINESRIHPVFLYEYFDDVRLLVKTVQLVEPLSTE